MVTDVMLDSFAIMHAIIQDFVIDTTNRSWALVLLMMSAFLVKHSAPKMAKKVYSAATALKSLQFAAIKFQKTTRKSSPTLGLNVASYKQRAR